MILIGPEGDFSETEVREAISCGFVPVSLGKSRLRTETAALLLATLLTYRTNEKAVYIFLLGLFCSFSNPATKLQF